jgi:antitoxin CcdA
MVIFMASPTVARSGTRRTTNVTIDAALLDEAKRLRINVSRAASAGVAHAIAEQRRLQWLEDNRRALDSSNAFVDTHGLPLAQFRSF